jgi:hypothetical protein
VIGKKCLVLRFVVLAGDSLLRKIGYNHNMNMFIVILFAVIIAAQGVSAQTRNVTLFGRESDSLERVNLGNRKFHSAVKSYSALADTSDKYALIAVHDSSRFVLEPLAELGIGAQQEQSSNYYSAILGLSSTYSYKQKFTISMSIYGGYTSPLSTVDMMIDSINHFPQYDGYSVGHNGNYFVRGVDFYVNYRPAKFLLLSAGKGKKFIGDGYRSVILSASNSGLYYFDTEVDVGNFKYVFSINGGRNYDNNCKSNRTSYMIYHLFSYNPAKWLNIGGFETVMMVRRDSVDRTRMPDIHYINPVLFFRPLEFALGSPDNALMGLFGKITYLKNHILYAQFMLDDFNFNEIKEHNDTWNNKYAYQIGCKGYFGPMMYLLEYNYIRPFIYSHDKSVNAYAMYSQPLANPYGANLKEVVANLKCKIQNIEANILADYVMVGKDYNKYSFGNNILRPYTLRHSNTNNVVGQGIRKELINISAEISWFPQVMRNFSVFARVGNQHCDNIDNKYAMLGIKTSKLYFDRSL